VYNADDRAKALMQDDDGLKKNITATFGDESYANGRLNREYLAETVFKDPDKLARLNALVHPAVLNDFNSWASRQSAPYVLKEAALIYEAGSDKHLDKVIVVTAPEDVRIRRIMTRDGVSEEQVRARMRNQMPEEEKVRRADYVIDNGGEVLVLPQVLEVHGALLALC
jgi:dephospho-CoA kinase